MPLIESNISKIELAKITLYTFTIDNEDFVAHHYYGKPATMKITHNGTLIGTVDKPNTLFEFTVNTEANPLTITVWIERGTNGGAGIEVNGNPVQHAIVDLDVHIKNGKGGLYFFLFSLGVSFIFGIFNIFTGGGIGESLSYLVPLIIPTAIIIIAIVKYESRTKFALISGFIFGLVELIFYVYGLIEGDINTGSIPFLFIRLLALVYIVIAFQWLIQKTRLQSPDYIPKKRIKPSSSFQRELGRFLLGIVFAVVMTIGLIYIPVWIFYKIDLHYGTDIMGPDIVKYIVIALAACFISVFVTWHLKKFRIFFILVAVSLVGYFCLFDVISSSTF